MEKNLLQETKILYAESLFGFNTRQGLVRLSCENSFDIQITPQEARAFAHSILEAAEAAQTDEFIVNWLEKRIGLKQDAEVVSVLADFRLVREKMREGEQINPRK